MKKFIIAMRLLSHFKEPGKLTFEDVKRLSQGSYFRDSDLREIISVLRERRLITGRVDGGQWKSGRDLFKHVSF